MTVFVCGETVEEIWCAIYDAWMSRLGHVNVRLEAAGADRSLFCEYHQVEAEGWKAQKVADSICRKVSAAAYEAAYQAALSSDPGRADKIYRFLIYAFAIGARVMDRLQVPEVYAVFCLARQAKREAHHLIEFARFSERQDGVLVSRFAPNGDVLPLVAAHFGDRMPAENWILYDDRRQKAAVHRSGGGWVIVHELEGGWEEILGGTKKRQETAVAEWRTERLEEPKVEALWKTFFEAIAIRERANPKCQQNLLPLRFRPYMTEFKAEA